MAGSARIRQRQAGLVLGVIQLAVGVIIAFKIEIRPGYTLGIRILSWLEPAMGVELAYVLEFAIGIWIIIGGIQVIRSGIDHHSYTLSYFIDQRVAAIESSRKEPLKQSEINLLKIGMVVIVICGIYFFLASFYWIIRYLLGFEPDADFLKIVYLEVFLLIMSGLCFAIFIFIRGYFRKSMRRGLDYDIVLFSIPIVCNSCGSKDIVRIEVP